MSKIHPVKDSFQSIHPSLFDTGMAEGAMDVALGFRQGLSKIIHQSGKDRYQIAAEISRLTQRDFSKDSLDKCTGSDTSHGLRAEALPALCCTLDSLDPFHYLLAPLGAEVLQPVDVPLFRLARLEEQKRKLDAEVVTLRAKCGIR